MARISERLESAIKVRGILQSELAELTGIARSSICTYVKGEYEPKQRNLYKLAKALDVDVDWLMGYDVPIGHFSSESAAPPSECIASNKENHLPVLNTVTSGMSLHANESDEFVVADKHYDADFALRITNDSMENAGIHIGDVVLIHKQDNVNNGQIAAVIIDGCAALKRVYHTKDHIMLISENPKYEPIVFEIDNKAMRIIGLAVAFICRIN